MSLKYCINASSPSERCRHTVLQPGNKLAYSHFWFPHPEVDGFLEGGGGGGFWLEARHKVCGRQKFKICSWFILRHHSVSVNTEFLGFYMFLKMRLWASGSMKPLRLSGTLKIIRLNTKTNLLTGLSPQPGVCTHALAEQLSLQKASCRRVGRWKRSVGDAEVLQPWFSSFIAQG